MEREKEIGQELRWGKSCRVKRNEFPHLVGNWAAIWEEKVCDCVSSHLSLALAPAAGPLSVARVKKNKCV